MAFQNSAGYAEQQGTEILMVFVVVIDFVVSVG